MATREVPGRRPVPPSRRPSRPARGAGAAGRSALGRRVADVRRAGGGAPPPRTSGFVLLVAVVAVLVVIGLVMVLSASSVQALRAVGSPWYYFLRQILWVVLGGLAMALAARLDYRIWGRLAVPAVAVATVLLVLVLVPGFGISVSGSTRWLGVGQWRVQPSEFAKFGLLVFAASLLAGRAAEMDDPRRSSRPVLVVALPVLALVMLQPDMGTTLVAGCIVLSLLFVAGVPLLRMGRMVAVAAGAALLLGYIEPYRRDRILAFLDPWKDPAGIGYQTIQGQVALAEGGLSGVGLGASRAKWGFLPNAHTDFIFAIIGDELGFLGGVLVVALFAGFAVLGMRAAVRAPDRFGMLLAAGITAWVVGQAFINMGAVIGMLPITGVPLPFVSFGGSSLVVLMFGVGILLNVARQGR